jgi:ApbE superfamily uncharacterized protein (UPF0280 family)
MTKAVRHAEAGAKRFYRERMKPGGLVRFDVREGETDLSVFAEHDLSRKALSKVRELRRCLEEYAEVNEGFVSSLRPLDAPAGAPEIVRRMCAAAAEWDVGPMAAVAGAFAEMVGEALWDESGEVIVENGGDIYLHSTEPRRIAIFAGEDSPFGGKLAVTVAPEAGIRGICTSSGTVGHSLSYGRADAVVAFADSAVRADAAATATGNRVGGPGDIERIVEEERERGRLAGLVIIAGDRLGAFGSIEFA